MLSLLLIEAVCERIKKVGFYDRRKSLFLETGGICRDLSALLLDIALEHWQLQQRYSFLKGGCFLCLKYAQCFVDGSPAEDSSNGTSEV